MYLVSTYLQVEEKARSQIEMGFWIQGYQELTGQSSHVQRYPVKEKFI